MLFVYLLKKSERFDYFTDIGVEEMLKELNNLDTHFKEIEKIEMKSEKAEVKIENLFKKNLLYFEKEQNQDNIKYLQKYS